MGFRPTHHERSVPTSVRTPVDVVHERLVQAEDRLPVVNKRHGRDIVLHHPVSRRRVVEHDARDVVVRLVRGVVHGVRDVRDVVARVRLAGDVDLAVVQTEGVHEVLEEAQELRRDFDLVGRRGRASLLAEAGTRRLLDPDD